MSDAPDVSKRGPGEFELIGWIRAQVAPRIPIADRVPLGIGDDCAAVRFTPGRAVLVTTDMLMDGRHFRTDRHSPEQIGTKAMGVNLSDIAAMAGVPVAAVVAVALPRRPGGAAVAELAHGLHRGLAAMARLHGVALVGGDTNAWDGPLVVSVTVLGEATGRGPVRRAGAEPGDVIFVTGPLGGSLLGRHLSPRPRVDEARQLHEIVALHAMIDISDGLAADLGHILEESGNRGATLDAGAIPIHDDASTLSRRDGRPPLAHALHDGEDFELCFAVAPEDVARLQSGPPEGVALYRVGTITAEPGLRLRHPDGRVEPIAPRGFDHLRDDGGGAAP